MGGETEGKAGKRTGRTIEMTWPEDVSTNNLAILLQKLAKNVSHYEPKLRASILREAAARLIAYRQAERKDD